MTQIGAQSSHSIGLPRMPASGAGAERQLLWLVSVDGYQIGAFSKTLEQPVDGSAAELLPDRRHPGGWSVCALGPPRNGFNRRDQSLSAR